MKPYVNIICLLSLLLLITGCNQQEINKLRDENHNLKNEILLLKQEVSVLKETADNYYRMAESLNNSGDLESAHSKYSELIEKYPASSLSKYAKIKIKAIEAKINRVNEINGLEVSGQELLAAPEEYWGKTIKFYGRFIANDMDFDGTLVFRFSSVNSSIRVYVKNLSKKSKLQLLSVDWSDPRTPGGLAIIGKITSASPLKVRAKYIIWNKEILE